MTEPDRARAAILGRLRDVFARTSELEAEAERIVEERVFQPKRNLIPKRGQLPLEERVELFVTMARGVQAEVQRLERLADVPPAVTAFLRRHNLAQKVVVASDSVLQRANFASQSLLRTRMGNAEDADRVGVTIAFAGIAETGTLMLCSSSERPTMLAFRPENSIVVLHTQAIVGAYEQAWQALRDQGNGLPRSVNFITGPSRTGDIAQKLELGAHGPKRLAVLLVDDLASG